MLAVASSELAILFIPTRRSRIVFFLQLHHFFSGWRMAGIRSAAPSRYPRLTRQRWTLGISIRERSLPRIENDLQINLALSVDRPRYADPRGKQSLHEMLFTPPPPPPLLFFFYSSCLCKMLIGTRLCANRWNLFLRNVGTQDAFETWLYFICNVVR